MRADLKAWAKEALERNNDDPDTAAMWLANSKDKNLRLNILRFGSQQIVRSFFHAQRASAMSMATGRVMATLNDPGVEERMASRMARQAFWETYTLYGMTPIKDATREDLELSASKRETNAHGELRLAKFERKVAAQLSDEQCVSDVLTSEAVEAIARAI
tara:strand:- start:1229 stop:1708 length:480 start_codon:yes stop_codon:yes gene_type:complete